jgi:hypothetical protein
MCMQVNRLRRRFLGRALEVCGNVTGKQFKPEKLISAKVFEITGDAPTGTKTASRTVIVAQREGGGQRGQGVRGGRGGRGNRREK